jgi:CheY-like chemotaxis protein
MTSASTAKKILVVEDDGSIREDLVSILAFEGYEAQGAQHGQVALEMLRADPGLPSLVLLDIMMPIMDGWAFRATQVQDPGLASIPVVVMTADGHAPQKAAKMGAQGYIQKPIIDIDAFLETIARHAR